MKTNEICQQNSAKRFIPLKYFNPFAPYLDEIVQTRLNIFATKKLYK